MLTKLRPSEIVSLVESTQVQAFGSLRHRVENGLLDSLMGQKARSAREEADHHDVEHQSPAELLGETCRRNAESTHRGRHLAPWGSICGAN